MTGEDEKQNSGFSLEEILAEYGAGDGTPSASPEPCAPEPPKEKGQAQKPKEEREQEEKPASSALPEEKVTVLHPSAGELPKNDSGRDREDAPPARKKGLGKLWKHSEPEEDEKIVPFPEESPLSQLREQLQRKADSYAEHMFEEAETGQDPETLRIEELVPGVDKEEPVVRERRKRREDPPAPDIPAKELFRTYSKGLKSLRTRSVLVLICALMQLYLVAAGNFPRLPGLPDMELSFLPQIGVLSSGYISALLLVVSMLLGADVLAKGIAQIFRLRVGMDTLTALSCFAAVADAVTMPMLGLRDGQLPYCGLASLALFCAMRGVFRKKCGQRLSCRTAAAAKEPYLVTLDEGKWSGRDTFTKWQGEPDGFGSQIQGRDGAERIFNTMSPLLLTAAVLFALISSLGQRAPERLLWCLSANLSAAASLSGMLAFGVPFHKLSRHLAKSGAAIAGWAGVENCSRNNRVVLTDLDLFPPGTVSLNGIKVFGEFPVERVIGYTATVIRDCGSGLGRIFHDLLRTQGAVYRETKDLQCHEGGGVSAVVRSQQVLVGSAPFMALMEISLPKGLSVKNAVFCAIDGELAGIFALHYTLHPTVPPALDALLKSGIHPVLATRDFNVIPSMLRQRFKLQSDKMEFPPVNRRRELSGEDSPHSERLTAVLCREGLAPFADAVVGAQRLRAAVKRNAVLACIGSVIGLLMSFYLTFVAAYAALSAFNLTVFAVLWLVPTLMISGGTDQY